MTEQKYEYFDENVTAQYIGENTLDFLNNDAFKLKNNNFHVPNVQTNRSHDKSNYEIKIFTRNITEREIETLSISYMQIIMGNEASSSNQKYKLYKDYNCSMVLPLYIRIGKVFVTSTKLIFFDDLRALMQKGGYDEDHSWKKDIEFVKFKKETSKLSKSWNISDIIMVHYRSFLSKN